MRAGPMALLQDESGNATMEFVIVFPLLMFFVLMILESGLIATRSVLLERGLDVATRSLRLGTDPNMDYDTLKARVCDAAGILMNCRRDLLLEVRELDLNSPYPQNQPNCVDRTGKIAPKITFSPGGRNRLMFVRACIIIDPIFPGFGLTLGLPRDSSGGLQLVSYTAFMNEPE